MNLFEINRVLAVKLNQSFSSLYELPYYEYRSYLDILLDETDMNRNQQFELEKQTGPRVKPQDSDK
jgi:hypothetical protein